jgi:hypothetical protein
MALLTVEDEKMSGVCEHFGVVLLSRNEMKTMMV